MCPKRTILSDACRDMFNLSKRKSIEPSKGFKGAICPIIMPFYKAISAAKKKLFISFWHTGILLAFINKIFISHLSCRNSKISVNTVEKCG